MIDKFAKWLKHNAEYDLSYFIGKPQARWTIADNVKLELLYRRTLALPTLEEQQIYLEVELGIERGGLTG